MTLSVAGRPTRVEGPKRAVSVQLRGGGSGGDGHGVAPSRRAEWTSSSRSVSSGTVPELARLDQVVLEDPPTERRRHDLRRTRAAPHRESSP